MRFSLLALMFTAQSAVACPAPEGALMLDSADAGAPKAYAVLQDPPVSAPFEIQVAICSAGSERFDTLTFDALMPDHQHGMNYRTDVTRLEDNRFVVSNVVFHMPGLWQMNISASLGEQTFGYVAEVTLE